MCRFHSFFYISVSCFFSPDEEVQDFSVDAGAQQRELTLDRVLVILCLGWIGEEEMHRWCEESFINVSF